MCCLPLPCDATGLDGCVNGLLSIYCRSIRALFVRKQPITLGTNMKQNVAMFINFVFIDVLNSIFIVHTRLSESGAIRILKILWAWGIYKYGPYNYNIKLYYIYIYRLLTYPNNGLIFDKIGIFDTKYDVKDETLILLQFFFRILNLLLTFACAYVAFLPFIKLDKI